jgi:hypothetical protein
MLLIENEKDYENEEDRPARSLPVLGSVEGGSGRD